MAGESIPEKRQALKFATIDSTVALIGLKLIFGVPLEIGVIITALDVFLILYLQRAGFAGGSKFDYTLLIVALISNIIAIVLQSLCARLAIASGRPSLPGHLPLTHGKRAMADPDWGAVIRNGSASPPRSNLQPLTMA